MLLFDNHWVNVPNRLLFWHHAECPCGNSRAGVVPLEILASINEVEQMYWHNSMGLSMEEFTIKLGRATLQRVDR